MELSDTKEFFHAAKTSDNLVVHFYRPTTRYCLNVDAHFEKLAEKHMETRFVKINAEKSDYLVDKLGIVMVSENKIVLLRRARFCAFFDSTPCPFSFPFLSFPFLFHFSFHFIKRE